MYKSGYPDRMLPEALYLRRISHMSEHVVLAQLARSDVTETNHQAVLKRGLVLQSLAYDHRHLIHGRVARRDDEYSAPKRNESLNQLAWGCQS